MQRSRGFIDEEDCKHMSDIVKEPTEDCLPLIHIILETTTNFNLSLLDSNTKISLYFQSINHKPQRVAYRNWYTIAGLARIFSDCSYNK